MANESTGKNPEQGPANLWRRALKLEGNDPAEAIKEFGEKYWYCVYVWWRRAGLDPITAATATAASFNIWANEKPPKMSDPNADNMRGWTALRLHDMAQEGIRLTGDPGVLIGQKVAEKR